MNRTWVEINKKALKKNTNQFKKLIGSVLIKGKRARILGRVCMNMTIVDIGHIKGVKPEDEVMLLGKQKKEKITAEELAQKVGTINYEIVTKINPLILRITI